MNALLQLVGWLSRAGLSPEVVVATLDKVRQMVTMDDLAVRISLAVEIAQSLQGLTASTRDDRLLEAMAGLTSSDEFAIFVQQVRDALSSPRIAGRGGDLDLVGVPTATAVAEALRG